MPSNIGLLELFILLSPVILGVRCALIVIGSRRRPNRNPSNSRKSSPTRPRYPPPATHPYRRPP